MMHWGRGRGLLQFQTRFWEFGRLTETNVSKLYLQKPKRGEPSCSFPGKTHKKRDSELEKKCFYYCDKYRKRGCVHAKPPPSSSLPSYPPPSLTPPSTPSRLPESRLPTCRSFTPPCASSQEPLPGSCGSENSSSQEQNLTVTSEPRHLRTTAGQNHGGLHVII